MSGAYIALEGPDGAGKTTQMKALADSFAAAHHEYILVREPGSVGIGKQIREIPLVFNNQYLHAGVF